MKRKYLQYIYIFLNVNNIVIIFGICACSNSVQPCNCKIWFYEKMVKIYRSIEPINLHLLPTKLGNRCSLFTYGTPSLFLSHSNRTISLSHAHMSFRFRGQTNYYHFNGDNWHFGFKRVPLAAWLKLTTK